MKYFLVIAPLAIQLLTYHQTLVDSSNCRSPPTSVFPKYGLPVHQVITVTPDQPATVSCHIYCNGTDWSGCKIRPNAIVVVPQANYSTFEVCNTSEYRNDHFDNKGYNVTARCDLNGIESETLCGNRNSELTYNITLNGFANSTLQKFVIVCALSRNFSLTESEPLLMVNALHSQVAIIQVREVEVVSDQINLHPALNVKEGDDVQITCARTPETISEWRFSVKQSNGDKIKLLLPQMLEQMNIKAQFHDGDIDTNTRLQNFSTILIDVKMNMTGIVIECGAKRSTTSQTQFYHKAAVLIVKGASDQTGNSIPVNSAESDSFVTPMAVTLVTVLAVIFLTSAAGYVVRNLINGR